MKASELRKKFIDFFSFPPRDHKEIPSSSLVPEDDPTVLFTTAGMHPLVPYLMGQPHPLGKRLCSVQKCLRTDDIEEIGDSRHFSFFEMLGNWSLGNYFKKEAIEWSFEFLTDKNWLGLEPKKIYISVFEGDKDASKDEESIKIWQETFKKVEIEAKVGDWRKPTFKNDILQERIFAYEKSKNWWGPAGQTGPCGPDTEMFYDTGLPHNKKFGEFCHPNCDCGRFVEIWNDVFMEFNKKANGSFESLKQKNVDTGLGLERVVALTEFIDGKIVLPDPFLTELFTSMIRIIEAVSGKKYKDYLKEFRIILDHLRAAVFVIADGVEPSNKDRGYILRKLLRRSIVNLSKISGRDLKEMLENYILDELVSATINIYKKYYLKIGKEENFIRGTIKSEWLKFKANMKTGYPALMEVLTKPGNVISGLDAFHLFDTYGVHPDITIEAGKRFNKKVDLRSFQRIFGEHRDLSRKGAQQKFAGGLQDHSQQTTKLHTATHLLHAALRKVLGTHVQQVGSNITAGRLRFDFTHSDSLTEEQIKKVENLVNEQIKKNLAVKCETMSLKEAQKQGALAFFGQKYPEKVKVYMINNFSKEVCGGPHVDFTGELRNFKIVKERAVGVGKRRIYATVF